VGEHFPHVVEVDGNEVDGRERTRVRTSHAAVEHRHFTEQRPGTEHGEDRFLAGRGLGHDRDPTREDDVQLRRRVALLEDVIPAPVASERGPATELFEQLRGQCAEEIGLVEHGRTCRHVRRSLGSREAIRASAGPTPCVAGHTSHRLDLDPA
jgi:hypothetical protein